MEKISNQRLMKIGQEVASCWGAVCTGFKRKKDSVLFHCNECGDVFDTEVTYKEIDEDYSYIK